MTRNGTSTAEAIAEAEQKTPPPAPVGVSIATLNEQLAIAEAFAAQLLGQFTATEAYQAYVRQTGVVQGLRALLATLQVAGEA